MFLPSTKSTTNDDRLEESMNQTVNETFSVNMNVERERDGDGMGWGGISIKIPT